MQDRTLPRSIQSALSSALAFLRWLLKPEKLEDAPRAASLRSNGNNRSFVRWLFSQDSLEDDLSTVQRPKEPSFISWLAAPEHLESTHSEHDGDNAESKRGA